MDQLEDNAAYYAKLHKKITTKSSKIIDKVVAIGLAKDAKSATVIIGVATGLCIIASIAMLVMSNKPGQPTYREDIPADIKKTLSPEFINKFPSREQQAQQK